MIESGSEEEEELRCDLALPKLLSKEGVELWFVLNFCPILPFIRYHCMPCVPLVALFPRQVYRAIALYCSYVFQQAEIAALISISILKARKM